MWARWIACRVSGVGAVGPAYGDRTAGKPAIRNRKSERKSQLGSLATYFLPGLDNCRSGVARLIYDVPWPLPQARQGARAAQRDISGIRLETGLARYHGKHDGDR
jgi:hypothetical protein